METVTDGALDHHTTSVMPCTDVFVRVADAAPGQPLIASSRVRFDVVMGQETVPILRLTPAPGSRAPALLSIMAMATACEVHTGCADLRLVVRDDSRHGFGAGAGRRARMIISPRDLSQLDSETTRWLTQGTVIVEVRDDRIPWISLIDAPIVREVRLGQVFLASPRRVMALIPLVSAFRATNKAVSLVADDRNDAFFGHRDALIAAGVSAIDCVPTI